MTVLNPLLKQITAFLLHKKQNPLGKEFQVRSQLYVSERIKANFKSQITSHVKLYEKFLPIFNDIEKEAEKIGNDFYNGYQGPDDDAASIAEKALDISIEYYSYLKLGLYILTATWHATLYHLWEQQLRLFLFKETSHIKHLEFKKFCTRLEEIKKTLSAHKINIESFSCWSKIEELRLLCNVIKHGPGDSLEKLRKLNPSVIRKEPLLLKFGKEDDTDYVEIYKTTLLNETLNINETTLQQYKEALLLFWDEISEQNCSTL